MPRKRFQSPTPAADWSALGLSQLGTPDDLARVDTIRLHDDRHFRVNVYRTLKGGPIITDSFYVVVFEEVPTISPPITQRRYFDDILDSLAVTSKYNDKLAYP